MTLNELVVLNNNEITITDDIPINQHPIKNYLGSLDVIDITKNDYERYIITFFNYTYTNINTIEDITRENIENILPLHAEKYKQHLQRKDESKNTIKKKVNTIKYMYNYLLNKYSTNINGGFKWLTINPFATTRIKFREDDVKSYDSFTDAEIRNILAIANEQDKLLYEMAIRTGVRVTALINLKISDIKKVDGVYCITGKDKGGKKFSEPVTAEMYDICKELAKNNNSMIFKMNRQTAHRRLTKEYLPKIGLSDEEINQRGLCFHSFKKTSVVKVGKMTNGNVTEMQKKGHHSDPRITMNIYNKSIEDKSQDVGLRMTFDDIEINITEWLQGLSKEEIVGLIESCGNSFKNELMSKMK